MTDSDAYILVVPVAKLDDHLQTVGALQLHDVAGAVTWLNANAHPSHHSKATLQTELDRRQEIPVVIQITFEPESLGWGKSVRSCLVHVDEVNGLDFFQQGVRHTVQFLCDKAERGDIPHVDITTDKVTSLAERGIGAKVVDNYGSLLDQRVIVIDMVIFCPKYTVDCIGVWP
jgi:hypothetical protein